MPFAYFPAIFLPLFLPGICSAAAGENRRTCAASSCGSIPNISYPFRLKTDPPNCGDPSYELACENNRTILHLYAGKFFVEEISYRNLSIRVVDAGIQKDNPSSLPLYSVRVRNFTREPFAYELPDYRPPPNAVVTFISCPSPLKSTAFVDTGVSWNKSSGSSSSPSSPVHVYVAYGAFKASDMEESCSVGISTLVSTRGPEISNRSSVVSIRRGMAHGFEILWFRAYCRCEVFCRIDQTNAVYCGDLSFFQQLGGLIFREVLALSGCLVIGVQTATKIICFPFVLVFLLHKYQRRHLSMYDNIEEFLQSQNNLVPIRYSYSQIRKMTKGFKNKLGEGGYGSVYRGTLSSGDDVAVKMLGKAKGNGQEFVNEVATIGRIHHVNVVRLVGFCAENSHRAIVYDFMPNGSLDKHVFGREECISIPCEKMHDISLGVARGMEYLHRGCDVQILHFDIKPHNILLDQNFVPKISDFGLAKLYETNNSIVSLTAARGTMGYMAPELFYKNIGGVSHKADVYSYGMLLMEMASRRKNLNPFEEHLSEIYFPTWVYEQLRKGKEIEMGDVSDEERPIVKKMIMVALWCIQMKPEERPTMHKVVEMLEGASEALQMPPKPFLTPRELPSGS